MKNERSIFVYENWSEEKPIFLGTLFVGHDRTETYSFQYDENWLYLHSSFQFTLDPNLEYYQGRQYPINQQIFGLFSDSAPDRWGRLLMKRKEKQLADQEKRKPRKLTESDFLLGVYDQTRMGALRFKLDHNESFLSDDQDTAVPPWATLRDLEEASRKFEMDEQVQNDKWLNQLIKPGSSLGGARPKSTIQDVNGELWIAKFPSKHDDYDIGAWEKVTSDLARMCQLNVPETKLQKFSKLGSTFLSKRFDRKKNQRIHFTSALTVLGKSDGASAQDGSSYLDLIDFIKSNGASPKEDIEELWKRIIFNMAVSNTDDHLRNHGFILTKYGWRLSPLYDVNPVPYGDELAINVTEDHNQISVDVLREFARILGLHHVEEDIHYILKTVHNHWEKLALQQGISKSEIHSIRPAFSLADEI